MDSPASTRFSVSTGTPLTNWLSYADDLWRKLGMNPMTRSRLKAFLRNFLPRQVRAHRILAGPLRGRKMVTSWYHNFTSLTGRTEPDVNSWFAKTVREGETWLDIGANYGYTALALAGLV